MDVLMYESFFIMIPLLVFRYFNVVVELFSGKASVDAIFLSCVSGAWAFDSAHACITVVIVGTRYRVTTKRYLMLSRELLT